MKEAVYKMTGLILMIVSVFALMGGLYLPPDEVSSAIRTGLIIVGLLLLAAGLVCYHVLREDPRK